MSGGGGGGEDDEDWTYEPVTTLEGLLQRGRGLGALLAVGDPQAPRLVLACIRRDCRWDTNVDERHRCLARLVGDLGLPLAPVIALLEGGEVGHGSASEVLGLLALAGSAEAREALRAYIRDGERWMSVLESVAGSWPVADWDDLLEPVRARLVGREPEFLWHEPWLRWRDRLGLVAPPAVGRRPDALAGLDTGRLLALIAAPGTPEGDRSDALWSLSRRSPRPSPGSLAPLLALVPSLGARNGREISGLRGAVRLLGATALPAAREWAGSAEPWLALLALDVLTAHGELQDLPVLLAEFQALRARRGWCGYKDLALALARFGPAAVEAVPLLRLLWLRSPHSYERASYLTALAAIDPSGLDQVYVQSLWDCEADVRLLAVASAPDGPLVRERLARLRDDPIEDPTVRAAAAERVAALN
ncbi:hypothetical protein GCM10010495_47610 [Kitasatospora herbaricolor]|uniref:hypothetical protein n=1 Tax=Kitasatospora herbaricolor TaxID=68217 RepID=UPI00174951F3|nr:hypothetical protein [Kitasatospora herbaricolor]MDQ0307779.1 hypothetical protein [Kitasatospora herbaricolor]GGV26174.1 hypothetical protein GCM10010495_47610 [Kitasatospora herbaricolor]